MNLSTTNQAPAKQVCVFLFQLGGPKDLASIEPFLSNLFEDVLPLPRFLKKPLARLIAKRRTPEVTPLYQEIGGGSPLLANTEAQRLALELQLRDMGTEAHVITCMRYAPPRAHEALAYARSLGDMPWVGLSLYPHYSFATSKSSMDEIAALLTPAEKQQMQFICAYPDDASYIDAVVACIEETLGQLDASVQPNMHLLFSAHGLPMKLVREGDPYPQHIERTVAHTMACLHKRLPYALLHTLSYQSRVGPVRWLEPSTEATLKQLGANGIKHIMVVPIAFVSEHIETLHELDIQLKETALAAGVATYKRVPTVGTKPQFIAALAHQVLQCSNRNQVCCGLFDRCSIAKL